MRSGISSGFYDGQSGSHSQISSRAAYADSLSLATKSDYLALRFSKIEHESSPESPLSGQNSNLLLKRVALRCQNL
mgnify:CR=1 FL=1